MNRFYHSINDAVVFVDESFNVGDTKSFYSMAFAVVERDWIEDTRRKLVSFNSGEVLHASEIFHASRLTLLQGAIDLIAQENDGLIHIVSQPVADSDELFQARREIVISGIETLGQEVGGAVFERNKNPHLNAADKRAVQALVVAQTLPRTFITAHVYARQEPLLGIPDMVAWAYRQQIMNNNPMWFEPLADTTTVQHL